MGNNHEKSGNDVKNPTGANRFPCRSGADGSPYNPEQRLSFLPLEKDGIPIYLVLDCLYNDKSSLSVRLPYGF
jgi:hypothetical protein